MDLDRFLIGVKLRAELRLPSVVVSTLPGVHTAARVVN
ncbi:hypothetical protein COLO4_10510 [Corchorus olitorius]|uniref:Uncharacterized protein n=1 Tax=Corchorus olitorius TaxID=93759 RepID=A0A1R3K892_9ROSI|nr:hypothetical protein COLO4_10509 [Corchorus olitorius]OMP03280.1 hypothetical protein COLO4_10510 [Corchorus olitorius]